MEIAGDLQSSKELYNVDFVTSRYNFVTFPHFTIRYILLRFITIRHDSLHLITFDYISSHYELLLFVTIRYDSWRFCYISLQFVTFLLHFVTIRDVMLHFVTIRHVLLHFVTLRLATFCHDLWHFVTFRYTLLHFVTFCYDSSETLTKPT